MRLTLQQIEKVVSLIQTKINIQDYKRLLEDELTITLDHEAPDGDYESRIRCSLELINSGGRGDELIQALAGHLTDVSSQKKLKKLRRLDYTSPSSDPVEAILLGNMAFVNRRDLRDQFDDFCNPSTFTSRVLQIRGEEASGKSYSWNLIQHVALSCSIATPICIKLDQIEPGDPVSLMTTIRLRLDLSEDGWPLLPDDPQDSQAAKQLATWFIGKMASIQQPVWLVIDDLNGTKHKKETNDLVEHLAVLVQQSKPDNLWLILVGFGRDISDDTADWMLEEFAFAPGRTDVQHFFESLGKSYGQDLNTQFVDKIVNKAFESVSMPLNHANFRTLRRNIERISKKVQNEGGFPI